MSNKTNKSDIQSKKKKISEIFNHWLKLFGLLPSSVRITYEKITDEDHREIYFDICSHFPYRRIDLRVFPAGLELSDNDLSCGLLHEVLHVVLEPMCNSRLLASPLYMESCELVVEHLAHHLHTQLKKPRLPKV